MYVLKSPQDQSISATDEYRRVISSYFDLVLVETECPLEPNYVVIEDLPEDVSPDNLKRLNT